MRAYLKSNETLGGATSLLSIWHILRSTEFLHWTANLILSHYLRLIWVLQGSRARVCHYSWRTRNGSMKDNRRLDGESIFLQIKVADRFRQCKWSFRFFYLYIQFCAVFSLTKYAMLQTSRAMNKAVAIQSDCAFFYLFKRAFCYITSHLYFLFVSLSILPKSLPALLRLLWGFGNQVTSAGMSHLLGVRASIIGFDEVRPLPRGCGSTKILRWQRTTFITFHFWLWCWPWLFSCFFVGLCWSCPASILAYCFSTTNGRNLAGLWGLRHTPVASCKVYPGGCHLDRRYLWIPFSDRWRWGCERWQLLLIKGNFFPTPVSLPDRLSNQTTLENDQNEIETSQTEQLPMPDLWLVTKKGSGSDTY